ncbi:hypothetical protein MPSEU_000151500 [Mayamaea pseudoterrestris]|nr:hypothetical protein MPSEU_000151500 [Mayamaea pseudoterrestris]
MTRLQTVNLLLLPCLLFLQFPRTTFSYPLIAVLDDNQERCFRFNVPLHDDAHVMAVVLPGEDELPDQSLLETWYVDQLLTMAKGKSSQNHNLLPLQMVDEIPSDVNAKQSRYLEDRQGTLPDVRVRISNSAVGDDRPVYQHDVKATYFKAVVVNQVVRILSGKAGSDADITSEDKDIASLHGYGLCFQNPDPEYSVHIIFDIILASDDLSLYDEPVKNKKPTTDFDKDRHLTPLERTVDMSINAARSVLREMKYMEKRESRMRVTADSINSRVRWFGYLSVGVLLLVTYLQVTYLKRYFHKKKLM